MSIDRREFMKIGAIGLAGTYVTACNAHKGPKGGLHMRFRGLCLLEEAPHKMTVRIIDATKLTPLPPHSAELKVRLTALDPDSTSNPTRKIAQGRSNETWVWDLAGKNVSIMDQESGPEALEFDTSEITSNQPVGDLPMNSTKWIPDLKALTGATKRVRDDVFNCHIVLKRGRIEGADPTSRTWRQLVWTFKNKSNQQVVVQQSLTDTVLYQSPRDGQAPVIKVGSDVITLCGCPSDFVSIENLPTTSEVVSKDAPFALGHFTALYGLVDKSFENEFTVNPPNRKECDKCEMEPIFCPPGRI